MAKRVCYVHLGPHKTGTTSIQWFLKENRAELLKHGSFVAGKQKISTVDITHLLGSSVVKPWAEVFAGDVGREFQPNDFEICPPAWAVSRPLTRPVREVKTMAREILLDPTLGIKAPWNDLRKRNSGFAEIKSSG